MKKVIITVLSVSMCFLIVGIIITCKNKSKPQTVLSVKEAYSKCFNEDVTLDVPLYFSDKCIYNVKESIDSIYLSNTNTKVTVELIDVIDFGIKKYNEKSYNTFIYNFEVPCKNNIFIDDCFLNIVAENEILSVEIGSVSLRFEEELAESKELTINQASVLAKSKRIEGIILELENKDDKVMNIKNIEVDQINTFVDLNNILVIKEDYNEQTSITEVIKDYNMNTLYPNFNLESFELNGTIKILLPIKYLDNVLFTNTPIIITYEINGILDRYVLDDFKYVDNLYNIIDVGGVLEYGISNS